MRADNAETDEDRASRGTVNALDLRAVKIRLWPAHALQLGQAVVVVFLYLFFFAPLVPDLVREWYEHENFTYGFLIPFIVLYLLWQERGALRAVPLSPTPWGAVSLLATLLVGFAGRVIGDVFTMRVAMVLTLGSLIHLFMGTRYLKALLFPLAYLLLMVPPPYLVVKEVSYHLRMLDAAIAEKALQAVGVPVYRDSYFLHLPNVSLEVADVCSGVASLFALLALGMIYVHSLPVGRGSKALVMLGALVFPIVANLLRIFLVGFTVYYYGPVMLGAFFHQFTGTFTFGIALLLLIALGEFLRRQQPRARQRTRVGSAPERAASAAKRPLAWLPFFLALGIFAGVLFLSGHLSARQRVNLASDLKTLPAALGNYVLSKTELPESYEDPDAEAALDRFYEDPSRKLLELFVGYRSFQDGPHRLQSPKLNLPSRWNFVWVEPDRIPIPGSATIAASWMLTQKGESQRLVLYWYQARGRTFGDELSGRVDQVISVLSSGRTDGAVVRIATPVEPNESPDEARAFIKAFVNVFYPHLVRMLPG